MLAYVRSLNLSQFSFTPDYLFNLALSVFNMTETKIIDLALSTFVSPATQDTSFIQQLVADLNQFWGTDINLPDTSENPVGDLVESIRKKTGRSSPPLKAGGIRKRIFTGITAVTKPSFLLKPGRTTAFAVAVSS